MSSYRSLFLFSALFLTACPPTASCPGGTSLSADGRCLAGDGSIGDGGVGDGSIGHDAHVTTVDAGIDACSLQTYHVDGDGDGHGAETGATRMACTMPTGYAASSDDCDDTTPARHPGESEVCDALDNDCNGTADDGFPCVMSAATACTTSCGSTGSGVCSSLCALPTGTACTPPAELCDEVDQDCDGIIDEGTHAFGPRRSLGSATAQVMAFAVAPGYLVLYGTASGLKAQRFDATGALSGSELTVVPTAGAFGAALVGENLVVVWLDGGYVQGAVFNAATFAVVTPSTILNTEGSFDTRVQVVAASSGITVAVSGGGLYMLGRSYPALTGTANSSVTTSGTDFDLEQIGGHGFIAYINSSNHLVVGPFTVGSTSILGGGVTLASPTDPYRAPALHAADVGGGNSRLAIVWDHHGSTNATKQIQMALYDIAVSGGLTARDTAIVFGGSANSTTPDSAVESSALDVTWAGGRWVVSALLAGSGTSSTWSAFEVTESAVSAPVVGALVSVEVPVAENRSTAIVAGSGANVLFSASRTGALGRSYLWGCGS